MYHIDNRISALKEVQRLLNINPTGIYDENTRKEVARVQSNYNLEIKKAIEYETFNAILDEYKKRELTVIDQKYLFNPTFPYVVGDMDGNVELINDAMRLVLEDYIYEDTLPKGKYLSYNTISAANFLRKIFEIEPMEEIDETFVNRLLIEKNAIEIKRKYG